jgi:hypothetical protein
MRASSGERHIRGYVTRVLVEHDEPPVPEGTASVRLREVRCLNAPAATSAIDLNKPRERGDPWIESMTRERAQELGCVPVLWPQQDV